MARNENGRLVLEPKDIDLRAVFSVERLLSARGFFVHKEASHQQTILNNLAPSTTEIEWLYDSFHQPKKRLTLKNAIGIEKMLASNFQDCPPNALLNQQRFASSLEWYISELLVREFRSFSSSFGVELKHTQNPRNGGSLGDYDVLSVMGDTNLLYVECKSGGTTKAQIVNAVERGNSLFAIANIITLTHKTSFAHLKSELDATPYPGLGDVTIPLSKISIKGLPASAIFSWHQSYFLPRSDENIAEGLMTILRLIALARVELIKSTGTSDDDFRRLGFEVD